MPPTPPFWIVCIDPDSDPYERERDPASYYWEDERYLPVFTDQGKADAFITGITNMLVSGELFSRLVSDSEAMKAVLRYREANYVFSYAVDPVHDQRPNLVRF
jgi:hypothetical protein